MSKKIGITTIEKQKKKLMSHGVVINDDAFADYALMFIGYYHLGFYLYPFEKTYPFLDKRRRHEVQDGTTIEDAVALHDFDNDLRSILLKYTVQIETAFKAAVIYHLTTKYPNNPCWYIDKTIVDSEIVDTIIADYDNVKRNEAIRTHHRKHRKSKFAPAWKTLEFEPLGTIQKLYEGILKVNDKLPVNRQFKVPTIDMFTHYIDIIRRLRNTCAHGNIVIDIKLPYSILKGPAGYFMGKKRQRLAGIYEVMKYLLNSFSPISVDVMNKDMSTCFRDFFIAKPHLKGIVEQLTMLSLKDFS